jgi:hypothetical protein
MIRTGEDVLVAENEPHWASGADLVGDPVQGALQPAKTILRNQKFRRFLFSPQNIGARLQGKGSWQLSRDRAWGVFPSFPGHRLDTTVVTEASFCTKRRDAASFHESKGERIP